MDLPILLPHHLDYIKGSSSAEDILLLLNNNPADLIVFFEKACSDEAWAMANTSFMRGLLELLTNDFFAGILDIEIANRAKNCIHEHYKVLYKQIPKDVSVVVGEKLLAANSMLLGTNSSLLLDILRRECIETGKKTLTLRSSSEVFLEAALEYIHSGRIKELWKKDQYLVLKVLKEAANWEMDGMVSFCASVFSRYLHKGNALRFLKISHEEGWYALKLACIDYINKMKKEVIFHNIDNNSLSLEFVNLRDEALDVFEDIKKDVTHLSFHGELSDDPSFSYALKNSPSLVEVDISQTQHYSDRLFDIPIHIKSLNLSMCPWLTTANLAKILFHCSNLHTLLISSNTQLDYSCWPLLAHLKQLENLDVGKCNIFGDDLELISKASVDLKSLSLQRCVDITDESVIELARNQSYLEEVNLSKTNVGDSAIIELAYQCRQLRKLHLSRCASVTDFGVIEVVKKGLNLRFLDITQTDISKGAIEEIYKLNKSIVLSQSQ
ncbi:MAG: hypothetical protein VX777_09905 [Chlamydiota bacterium]|nr:hypothetical protein [Chlamydiota bacterium]